MTWEGSAPKGGGLGQGDLINTDRHLVERRWWSWELLGAAQ